MSKVKCRECNHDVSTEFVKCPTCGADLINTEIQQSQQTQTMLGITTNNNRPVRKKNRITAILLALFLGGFGAHKFYLGQIGWGFIYLIFCWTMIPALVSVIELSIYLTTSDEAFNAKYHTSIEETNLTSFVNTVYKGVKIKWWFALIFLVLSTCTVLIWTDDEFDAENKYAETMTKQQYAQFIKNKSPDKQAKLIELHSKARDKYLFDAYLKEFDICTNQNPKPIEQQITDFIRDKKPELKDELMIITTEYCTEVKDARTKYALTMNNKEYADLIKDKELNKQEKLISIHAESRNTYLYETYIKEHFNCNGQTQPISEQEFSELIKDKNPELQEELIAVFKDKCSQHNQTTEQLSTNQSLKNKQKDRIIREKSPDYIYPMAPDSNCYIPPCYNYSPEVLNTVELSKDWLRCGARECTDKDKAILRVHKKMSEDMEDVNKRYPCDLSNNKGEFNKICNSERMTKIQEISCQTDDAVHAIDPSRKKCLDKNPDHDTYMKVAVKCNFDNSCVEKETPRLCSEGIYTKQFCEDIEKLKEYLSPEAEKARMEKIEQEKKAKEEAENYGCPGAIDACHDYVRKTLISPSTAKFPSKFFSDSISCYPRNNNKYKIRSYVDAQNVYGAMIRHEINCEIVFIGVALNSSDYFSTYSWKLEYLELGNEIVYGTDH